MFFSRLTLNPVFRSFHDMQHEVNRVFDRLGRHSFGVGEFPALNLWQADDVLFLEAELPGLELSNLEIFVTGRDQLTIKGERKPPVADNAITHRQERGYGKFERAVKLPYPVNEEAVEARLEHGVLKIRLPKHESAKPRKIEIKG